MPIPGLEYLIKLNDQISAPLKSIKGELDRIGTVGKDAMMKIGAGAAGLAATGASLYAALNPAIEMSNALSQITATGMSDESLGKIEKFAMGFSSSFGVSATEVVNSANEIVRAIDGLTDEEVIAFTKSSNLLAKATGSSVQEMGSYLGTMYGIFQKEADAMGKAKWIEQMSGQATLTANMFKSSGESLSQAFTNLMATGQSKGVALAEQFAVLGNLQSVMPGGMSGTKYSAFLKGVGKAQQKLGLEFLDSQNRMKPITEILAEIKKAYGDTIDEVEALQLSKAFGSDDAVAVISYLLPKIDNLKDNIEQIGDVSNLDDAAKTAKIVTSVWDRLGNVFTNIRAAIGAPILKKITPFFDKLADMGASFAEWLSTYKNIARWIGYIVGGIIMFTGLAAGLTLFSGIFGAIALSASALLGPIGLIIAGIAAVIYVGYKFRNEFGAFFAGVAKGFKETSRGFSPLFGALGKVWAALQKLGGAFGRIFNAIFGGTEAINGFGTAGEFVGWLLGEAFNGVISIIEVATAIIANIADVFGDVAWIIIETWQEVLSAWQNSDILGIFTAIFGGVGKIFMRVIQGVKDNFVIFVNWLIDKINSIGKHVGLEIPKIQMEVEQAVGTMPDLASPAVGVANMAMQMANTQPLAPKPDASGQIHSLGSAQPKKFEKSPQLGKQIATNNNQQYITIQKIEVKDGADLERRLERRQKEAQMLQ